MGKTKFNIGEKVFFVTESSYSYLKKGIILRIKTRTFIKNKYLILDDKDKIVYLIVENNIFKRNEIDI